MPFESIRDSEFFRWTKIFFQQQRTLILVFHLGRKFISANLSVVIIVFACSLGALVANLEDRFPHGIST